MFQKLIKLKEKLSVIETNVVENLGFNPGKYF